MTSERASTELTLERVHLEEAHHELCTALTSLRSNLALARIALREASPEQSEQVKVHLADVDDATDRLQRLARAMRVWHG